MYHLNAIHPSRVVRATLHCVLLGLLAAAPLMGQMEDEDRVMLGDEVKKVFTANQQTYKDNPNVMVRSGLVAFRKEKRVEIQAESTGQSGGAETEFLVIASNSGHGYEALLWSHAKPSDVHKALEFIGLRAGDPYDPRTFRFQAKGPRVKISVRFAEDNVVRLEKLIVDNRTEETLPEDGFVFGGSVVTEEGEYGADLYEPHAVISMFNTPVTVMDVPRQAEQGEVFQTHTVNDEYSLGPNQLVTLILEPEGSGADTAMRDLILNVRHQAGNGTDAGDGLDSSLAFEVTDTDGKPEGTGTELRDAITTFQKLAEAGTTPYLSIRFGPKVTISEARMASLLMRILDVDGGIQIEPPSPGQLYYKAFLPERKWREREERFRQPWEIHLQRQGDKLKGKMVRHETIWREESIKPDYHTVTFEVANGEELKTKLTAYVPPEREKSSYATLTVLLIFAQADTTYGELMGFIQPVLATHDTVHVFIAEPPPAPAPAPKEDPAP